MIANYRQSRWQMVIKAMLSLTVRAKVWLFHLNRCRGRSLSSNIIREVCSYFPDLQLAQVTSTFLRFFDTAAWGPKVRLFKQIQADIYSVWVVLEDRRLLCSGGAGTSRTGKTAYWNVAYLLDGHGAVEQLPDMLTARHSHGVVQCLHVYIFGGRNF